MNLFSMNGIYNPIRILPTWQMYLLLEVITVFVEFLFVSLFFFDKGERDKKWNISEIFLLIFFANIISAVVGYFVLITLEV